MAPVPVSPTPERRIEIIRFHQELIALLGRYQLRIVSEESAEIHDLRLANTYSAILLDDGSLEVLSDAMASGETFLSSTETKGPIQ